MARTNQRHGSYAQAMMAVLVALLGMVIPWTTPTVALAAEVPRMDAFYQFFRSDPAHVEDYVHLDVEAEVRDGTLWAHVNPHVEAFVLREADVTWRVMVNFAGGTPAGERDVTDDATYDEGTGLLALPASYASERVSFVAQLPWMHPAHDLVKHWDREAAATFDDRRWEGGLRTAAATGDVVAGATYPIKNVASDVTGSYKPMLLGKDFDTHNLATLCGYPELEGRYVFFVAFEKDNCALFELLDAVPGRPGANGVVTTDYGDVIPRDLAGRRWVTADCAEDVNNQREIFFVLEDAGSWVHVDAIEGSVAHCTFRLSVDGPGGLNYQDVLGKFDLEMPYGDLRVCKRSARDDLTGGNGSYELGGAVYEVYDDAACTRQVGSLTTDAEGVGIVRDLVDGTYWVRERTAPAGYAVDHTVYEVEVRPGATVTVGGDAVADEPLYAGAPLTVQKVDANGVAKGQGDASLAGAIFEVAYYDGSYASLVDLPTTATRVWRVATTDLGDGVFGIRLGDARCELVGDETYKVDGDVVLPLGTVAVTEVAPPAGYLLSGPTTRLVRVVADPTAPGGARLDADDGWSAPARHVDALDLAVDDQVARGSVRLGKVDAEGARPLARGAATFEGATLAVELASERPVVVGGVTYVAGEVVATVALGADGTGSTPERALPYGSYVVYELAAPTGYLPRARSEWSRAFSIRSDGEVVDLSGTSDAVDDQVIRGDLELTKVAERTMARLAGVPFVIVSDTTGEAHVIVTDENGQASTTAAWAAHTNETNANDDAVTCENGVWRVRDEGALDPAAGVWFGGRTDLDARADDALGALPYDTYTLVELPVHANEGLSLVSFSVTVRRHGVTVSCGTIADRPAPSVATTLTDAATGTHTTTAGPVTLHDEVRYASLVPGKSYELRGTLHLVDSDGTDAGMVTDDDDGAVVTARTAFVAREADGSVRVTFSFDASGLAGQTVVAFEELLQEDVVVATHEDVTDQGQTVSFALLETTLGDDGGKLVPSTGTATVVDVVSYQGLTPGSAYAVRGVLMDRETGEAATDAAGDAIVGGTAFVADDSRGSIDVSFVFDADGQAGRTLVAFETLSEEEVELVSHADLGNEAQTVALPLVTTSAVDARTGAREALASHDACVLDTVGYRNLVPDETYELAATLVARGTGEAVRGSEETPAARLSFVAREAQGEVELAIPVDASTLAGTTVVVCERLYHDGRLVAAHVDPTDVAQSVAFPSVTTEATSETGTHELTAAPHAVVVDTVTYRNLTPGLAYVAVGTLHGRGVRGDDVGLLTDADGHEAAVSVPFVPEATDGTVRLSFDVDASGLAGTSVVAFEQIVRADAGVVAEHADIASEAQAVAVVEAPATRQELPRTGDGLATALPVALVGASAALFGLVGRALGREREAR